MTKILVIEDDLAVLEGVLEILELASYETQGVTNGVEGIVLARRWRPDLIVCDIMMPNLDGYGVLRQIREIRQLSLIPFIFLTAKGSRHDMRYGMNLGADDYLTKPFKPDELLQMIRTRLELQAGRQREYTRQMEQLRWSVSHALPHELRTPLTHVISYVSLLLEDLDQLDHDAIRNSLLTIQQAGDRLYAVVEKYMLYLHIEILRSDTAQIRELRTARSESAGMLIRDIAEAQAKAYGRKSDLLLEITAPAALQIAEHDLVEIVRELVDNALKFSDAGTPIRVVGTLEDGMFNLYVVDQGWGMTLEQISQVSALLQFDRVIYEQKGVGLGLTIARGLAELYGGSLDIESEVQVGTQVMVCLSLAEPVLQSN